MLFVHRYSRYLLFALLCILAAACATPQNARDKGPVASYKSTKTAKAVSACVAAAWESGYGLTNPVNVRPTEDGYSLQVSASAPPDMIYQPKHIMCRTLLGHTSKY